MPLYEYRCTACGHTFEVIQRFNDRPLRKCRECAGRLEKLISRTSFQLKGGGWFVNDYSGSKAPSVSSEKPSAPVAAATSSSESSSTAKPTSGSGGSH